MDDIKMKLNDLKSAVDWINVKCPQVEYVTATIEGRKLKLKILDPIKGDVNIHVIDEQAQTGPDIIYKQKLENG